MKKLVKFILVACLMLVFSMGLFSCSTAASVTMSPAVQTETIISPIESPTNSSSENEISFNENFLFSITELIISSLFFFFDFSTNANLITIIKISFTEMVFLS